MGMQKGRDFVLLVGDGAPVETFFSLAGVATRRFHFEARPAEVTDAASSGRWRELAGGAGVRGMTVTATGVMRNGPADALVRYVFANQTLRNWQMIAPGLGSFAGRFLITGMAYLGTQDGEAQWEMTLVSGGPLSFTPAA